MPLFVTICQTIIVDECVLSLLYLESRNHTSLRWTVQRQETWEAANYTWAFTAFFVFLLLILFASPSASWRCAWLLQDFSRPLCFWSPRQSWSSRCSSLSDLPRHVHPDLSLSLCFYRVRQKKVIQCRIWLISQQRIWIFIRKFTRLFYSHI